MPFDANVSDRVKYSPMSRDNQPTLVQAKRMRRSAAARLLTLLVAIALVLAGCAPIQAPLYTHLPTIHKAAVAPPSGPPASAYPADIALRWIKLLTQIVKRAPGFTPPIVARTYAYAGVALYEALVPGMPGYQSLAGQLNEMPEMPQPPSGAELHWPTVANATMAAITRHLFPTATAPPLREITKLENDIRAILRPQVDPAVFETSEAWGRAVADAVFAWSRSDGGDAGFARNVTSDFAWPVGDDVWQPTPPDFAPPLQPYWGDNRTMALTDGGDCAPPPPPEYSTDSDSTFYKEAREVYDTVRNLDDERREIAYFWADDAGTATPPGHSLSIAAQALQTEGVSLDRAAELFAKLGVALNDSFIACWHTKFIWNVIRPVTYIQQNIDANWNYPDVTDPVLTPPFPEYTSGHSVESRAASEVLTDFFGDHYRFTDITNVDRGYAPRTFSSFNAAAAEAAISRMYGGIHYRSAIEQGLAQGICVGRRVLALRFHSDDAH